MLCLRGVEKRKGEIVFPAAQLKLPAHGSPDPQRL